jgi:hypothetical protein
MAKIIAKSASDLGTTSTLMVHICGETIRVVFQGAALDHFEAITGTHISVCPDCLRDLNWDDLQMPDMVNLIGWP